MMGMDYKDYYRTLGVERGADEKAIKRAYRKLAREYHPDVRPDDKAAEAKFKEINEAYEVLGDPEKRKKYDQFGANWERFQQTGGQPGGFDWSQWAGGAGAPGGSPHYTSVNVDELRDLFGDSFEFSDFFSQLFGGAPAAGRGRQPRTRAGRDIEQDVPITLREAYEGATRILQKETRQMEVKIPAGAATGTRVRVSGEGQSGMGGGQQGDLYLKVVVQPDPHFKREGDDLHVEAHVDLYTAVLGGETPVKTLTGGTLMVRIPAGTQNGGTLRLRGKGMPHLRESGQHGDLLVKVQVRLPRHLSDRERELFEELRQLQSH
jgi:curved DNA-binding protein